MVEATNNQALKTVAKGAIFVYLGLILSKIFIYLYRIIVARSGIEEYGLLSLGLAVVSIVMYLPLLGMDEGVVRYVSVYNGNSDKRRLKGTITTALWITTPLSIISALILYLSANTIAINVLNEPRLTGIIQIFSIIIPFSVIGSVHLSVIKAHKRMDYWVLIKNIIENFAKVTITYLLILAGYGVIGATIGYILAVIISSLIAIIIVEYKFVPLFKSKTISIKPTRRLLLYSWPIMFHTVISQLFGWTDTLMIGYFKNSAEVGLYNAALPTAHILTIIPTGIMALFVPVMTELYTNKYRKEFSNTYKTTTKWIFYFASYCMVVALIYNKEIITLLFGKSYLQSAPSFAVLVIGYFIYSLATPTNSILKVIEKTEYIMVNTIISTLLNIILNYLFIPLWGMLGAAIASTISLTIWSLMSYFESLMLLKIHPIKREIIKLIGIMTLSTIIILPIGYYLSEALTRLILGSSLLFLIYLSLILIANCLDEKDIEIIKALINKIRINLPIRNRYA